MGKRSFGQFERRDRDRYLTPFSTVPVLIPYLRRDGVRHFAEPCDGGKPGDGGGALVRHLEGYDGLTCAYRGDVATGQDVLALGSIDIPAITNPAHDRKVMHPIIAHLLRIAPFSWLLIDYDWAATKQAASFLPHCTDIVVIGRVKWIEGSKHTGKDNYAWYRFSATHSSGPILHGRDLAIPSRCTCGHCLEAAR